MRATSLLLHQPALPSRQLVFPRMLSSKSTSSLLADRFSVHKTKTAIALFTPWPSLFSNSFRAFARYGRSALSNASDTAKYVAIAVTPTTTIRNRLRPAFSGDPPFPLGPCAPPAPEGPCSAAISGSRYTWYALPSSIICVSPSTVTLSGPRFDVISSSLAFSSLTCPIVGASDCARIAAFEASSVNACALPVENVAVPMSNFADGAPSLSFTIALLALSNSNLAAPARIWTLPWSSVLSRSPPTTVRITTARTGTDPAGPLTNLFTKTRDAMVAFELARYLESIGNSADAGRWYLTAAERFRRADWKTKAQESATRLGATAPAEIPADLTPPASAPAEAEAPSEAAAPAEPSPEESASPLE